MRLKWAYALISLLLALLVAAGIYWYRWKNPKAAAGFRVPEGTEVLAVLNSHRAIEDALGYGLKIKGDSGMLRSKIRESGIQWTEPFWIFGSWSQRSAGAAFKISDAQKLRNFLSQTLGLRETAKNSGLWEGNDLYVQISDELVYVSLKKRATWAPEGSADPAYLKNLQAPLGDTLIRGVILPGCRPAAALFAQFGDYVSFHAESRSDALLLHFARPLRGAATLDTGLALHLHGPQALLSADPAWPRRFLSMLKKQGLDTTGIRNAAGTLSAAVGKGHRVVKTRIISYGYDEEFNRVETVKIQSKNLPDFSMSWSCAGDRWYTLTRSDSQHTDRKSLNLFGWPCRVYHEQSTCRVETAGDNGRRSEADNGPAGTLWLDLHALHKVFHSSNLPWPGPKPANLHNVMFSNTPGGSRLRFGFAGHGNMPAWLALAREWNNP